MGKDYVETRGTLTFPSGTHDFVRTISVPILDDEIDEPEEETFSLILRNHTNAKLLNGITDPYIFQRHTNQIQSALSTNAITRPIKIVEHTIGETASYQPPPVNVNNGGGVVPSPAPAPALPGLAALEPLIFRSKQVFLGERGKCGLPSSGLFFLRKRNDCEPIDYAFWDHLESEHIVFLPN